MAPARVCDSRILTPTRVTCVSFLAEASATIPYSCGINLEEGTVCVGWTCQAPSSPPSAGYFVSVQQTAPVTMPLITNQFLLPGTDSFTFHLGVRLKIAFACVTAAARISPRQSLRLADPTRLPCNFPFELLAAP